MKYHDKASYCRKCLKPCDEVTILDGDGIRTWGTWVSACCHEPDVFTRREALECYLWKGGLIPAINILLKSVNSMSTGVA